MQGHPLRVIAGDLGYSESTAHRRINEAREHLREELAPTVVERRWLPFEAGTDPVLERAQRLFEQTSPPSLHVEQERGPAR